MGLNCLWGCDGWRFGIDVSQNLVRLLDRVWCVRNKPPEFPPTTNGALSGGTAGAGWACSLEDLLTKEG